MSAQFDFGFAPAPAPAIAWTRFPGPVRPDYQMTFKGEPTGYWVRCCGHPTALRKFYVEQPDGWAVTRKFQYVADAKAEAVRLCFGMFTP